MSAVLLGALPATGTAAGPLIAAAGDIACDPDSQYFNRGYGTGGLCRQLSTSRLLAGSDAVLTLGDNQYEHGSHSNFMRSYDRSWGRLKARTYPAIGNHEYGPGVECYPTRCSTFVGADGYFRYFGRRARPDGRSYYSFNKGDWHLIALNSQCFAVGCGRGSAQERWLRADLARFKDKRCVLAYWHHPPFSSGQDGGFRLYQDLWRALHEARADVILVGHDHVYERFGTQSSLGRPSRTGPREFMVGTGGKNIGRFRSSAARNSRKRIAAHGVLRLRLNPETYAWKFVGLSGRALDSGSARCV